MGVLRSRFGRIVGHGSLVSDGCRCRVKYYYNAFKGNRTLKYLIIKPKPKNVDFLLPNISPSLGFILAFFNFSSIKFGHKRSLVYFG